MNDTRTTDERIDTLADAIALLAVSGSTVFGGTDAREAVKEATRYKALCKCGIHDSCVDCHHENTSDDDERTCIQKLHDDFHAAEERARVLKAERDYWKRQACSSCGRGGFPCDECIADARAAIEAAIDAYRKERGL